MRAVAARAAALSGAIVLGTVGWFGGVHQSGNLHPVRPAELYRAGQLDAAALGDALARDGIATVLNLRGAQPDRAWYQAERSATEAAGALHLDFRMSASQSLSEDEARRLIALMREAPKPLLIHCEGGADRTGLATALYLAAIDRTPLDEAARALSARYGHVGIKGVTRAWAMDESWARLKPLALGEALSPQSRAPAPSTVPAGRD